MTTNRKPCIVPSCLFWQRRTIENLSFHRFPNSTTCANERQQWVDIIRSLKQNPTWEPDKHTVICSRHFSSTSFALSGKTKRLISNSIPTIELTSNAYTDNNAYPTVADLESTGRLAKGIIPSTKLSSVSNVLQDAFEGDSSYLASGSDDDLYPSLSSAISCPNCAHTFRVQVGSDGKIELGYTADSTRHPGIKSRKRLFDDGLNIMIDEDLTRNSSDTTGSTRSKICSNSETVVSSIMVTPRSRKKLRAEHSYGASPGEVADNFVSVKNQLDDLKKQYRVLERKLQRRQKAQQTLKDKLIEQKSLNLNQIDNLKQEFPKLLQSIVDTEETALRTRGKTGIVYDEEIKKFSATLHFYSPKAYNFVREFLTLPHPHTITSWMRSSNCGPGFNTDVMARLAEVRRLDEINIMSDIVMMIDEMAIRKELVWNPSAHSYEGHIDYGLAEVETHSDLPLASDVLVCMIAGISGGWKVPIGYIFTDKTDSDVQRTFVDKAFLLLEESGFNVHALISDGNTANVALFDSYGVKENPSINRESIEYTDIVADFPNPANPLKRVHAVYDVCHMLKLWRNLLAQCEDITMGDGRVVRWEYLVRLYQLQDEEKIRAANKLGRNHIEFGNHKMNVRLAAQSISKSNADAIVFCRDSLNLKEFQGSEGTTYFMYLLNKVFDILNSRNPAQKSHKAPLKCSNIHYQTTILQEFCTVVLSMTYLEVRNYKSTKTRPEKVVKTKKILVHSARKRAAIGMVVSIKSILAVSTHLLNRETRRMRYIMTYRFSQDLLELFFNKIRGRLGRNNNPNTLEFKHTMKANWHQNLLKSSNTGNCIEQMAETSVPVGLLPLKRSQTPKVKPLELEDIGNLESIDLSLFSDPKYSPFYKNCLAYIAGNVVRVVGTKLSCEICAEGMLDIQQDALNSQYRQLIIVKDRGGLFVPCQSVFCIIEMADTAFRLLVRESAGFLKLDDLDRRIFKLVLLKCLEKSIFPHIQNHFIDFDPLMSKSHLHTLIREIVLQFLKIRLFDYGKRFQKTHQISTRHTLNKITLFRGQ